MNPSACVTTHGSVVFCSKSVKDPFSAKFKAFCSGPFGRDGASDAQSWDAVHFLCFEVRIRNHGKAAKLSQVGVGQH